MSSRRILHAAVALAFALPGAALAQHFEAVDTIPSATGGRFPAYPVEPLRPTEIYVRGGWYYDNNMFRLSSAANTRAILGTDDRSNWVTRAGVGLRHESLVAGRQRLRFTANVDRYDYDKFNLLDHTEYSARGEWLWEFTNDLAGTVGYEKRQRLVDLAQRQFPVKDLILEDHAFLTGGYMVGPNFRLRGGLDGARARHSDTAFNIADARTTTATGAGEYVTPLGNAAGVEFRRTTGNFPVQEAVTVPTAPPVFVNNDFTEKEVAGVLTWRFSPQLYGVGRLGRTQRTHVEFPARNFSGTTGRAMVDWTPLNKTGFEFAAYKEPRSIVDIAASYMIVKGVTFGPRWAPSEKLVFTGLVLSERQDFRGDPNALLVPGTPERQESIRGIRLGGSWEPMRFSQVQLGWDHGKRSSNVALRDYDYNAVMLNVRLYF